MNTELHEFLKKYEDATNTHDFEQVVSLIHPDAVYFFSEQTLRGIDEIRTAFMETWETIQGETYRITNIEWLVSTETTATCIYQFHWKGVVEGKLAEGVGRGTNVLIKQRNHWYMLHEHLSTIS